MALTLTTEPADIVPAYRPVEWELTSDRFGNEIVTVTSVSDDGGFAKYNVASHPYIVGDTVTPSLDVGGYNVAQTITAITATTIKTDLSFISAASGTIQRTNDSFSVKAEIINRGDEPVKSLGPVADGSPEAIFGVVAHGYIVGDIIEITGTTNYNGFHKVSQINGPDVFEATIAFAGNDAGSVQKMDIVGVTKQQAISVLGVDTFRFDLSTYLQALVSFFLPSASGNDIVSPNPGITNTYSVLFTEQFNDKDGLLQEKDSLIGSSTDKFVMNATLQHLEVQDLIAFTTDSPTKRFLTNIPANQPVARTEFINLSFLTDETDLKVRLIEFDSAGGSTVITTSTFPITDKSGVMRIDMSTLLTTTVRVQVFMLNATNTQRSEIIQFFVDDRCYDQSTRVWFLNRLGNMDNFTLTGDIKERIKTRITNFDRRIGSGFVTTDRGTTALGVKVGELFDVFSDFLTADQRTWLSELLTSPVVFIQEGSVFVPVINLSKTITRRDGDQIQQIKFSYTLSNNAHTQTG